MIRGKNDKVDAQRIATYAYKNRDEVRLWVPKRDVIQRLDRLTALRNRLVKVRKMMQSPLTDCKDFLSKKDLDEVRKGCQGTMKALDKDIKKVKLDIQGTIQSDGSGQPSVSERTLRPCRISKRGWPRHRHRDTHRYKRAARRSGLRISMNLKNSPVMRVLCPSFTPLDSIKGKPKPATKPINS